MAHDGKLALTPALSPERIHRRAIRQVATDEGEWFPERSQCREVLILDRGIIKIVQVIEGPDRVAACQQSLGHV